MFQKIINLDLQWKDTSVARICQSPSVSNIYNLIHSQSLIKGRIEKSLHLKNYVKMDSSYHSILSMPYESFCYLEKQRLLNSAHP